jgi:hypothetical protein
MEQPTTTPVPAATDPDPDASDMLRSPSIRYAYFTPTGVLTEEGRRVVHTMSETMAAAFRPIALAVRQASAQFGPLAALLQESQRGPTIGRKRRARRARGRARQINHTTHTTTP